MELKQVVQWLLDNKYGLIVNNQFVLTQKLNQDLFSNTVALAIDQQVSNITTNTTIDIAQTSSNSILKLTSPSDKKIVWNEFIERACIPHRVKATDGGSYTVRQYSPSAVNKLIQIIKTPEVDYDRLVASTKHYYATVSYKVLLSNYLLKDMWRDEYQNYKPGTTNTIGDGSTRWED